MVITAIFVAILFAYALVSKKLEKTPFTAPIIFTAAGAATQLFLAQAQMQAPVDRIGQDIFLKIAELGLVLLLFIDGSRISYDFKGGLFSLPGRLLSAGMLLTILFGLIAALLLFGELSVWEAGILAAVLAPTDAGLGQAIVSNKKVPRKIREALNVEAGLNDGLSVPFLLFFIAMAEGSSEASFLKFFVEQFGYGCAIGIVVGMGGSELYRFARTNDWMSPECRQIAFAALPIMCMIASEATGASMFIAAFVAGLAVRRKGEDSIPHQSATFAEHWGQLINLAVFFLFGILAAGQLPNLKPIHFVYAALSLTVVRMLPVAIALSGTRLTPATIGFMGWFGPRGLASIVLGLVYLEHTGEVHEAIIHLCVVATVFTSILMHGFTAKPGSDRYAARVARLPPTAPEVNEAEAKQVSVP